MEKIMKYEIYGVYLIDFKQNLGGELSGKHYAVIVGDLTKPDNTILAVPMTSKKSGKKYRKGFTINCKDYQSNPSYEKAFVRVNKLREVSVNRIYGKKIYSLSQEDIYKLKESIKNIFYID